MFLKRIEAEGFKSFADKTIISFPTNGLVAFVGPNGSGKSNINDSIKWVLGEQSAKSLRGNSMTDIIFVGSKNKKASNLCEVTLVFNNENKILNSEYSEIQITRRLFRDKQENEYLINGQKCRLKDIRYLMMNTGLGKNSFSIISQGSITKLADSKPLERKVIFEEAAGVSVYKEQKLESLRKLSRTTQNLEIIEVSVDELKKQVNPLKKQAEKAKIFLEKKKVLEEFEVSLIAEELKIDLSEIEEVNNELKTSSIEKDLKSNLVNSNQTKTSSLSQKIILLSDEINTLEHNQREVQSKINNLSKASNKEMINSDIGKDNISIVIEEIIQEELIIKDKLFHNQDIIDKINSQKNNSNQLLIEDTNSLEKSKIQLSRLQFEKEIFDKQQQNKNHLSHGPATVIKNKSMFNGVIDVVSNVFTVEQKFELAIETALGFGGSQNIIIREDKNIRKIITFLKDSKNGRATFLPLNIIHRRTIDQQSMAIVSQCKGFQGVASDILNYDEEVAPAIDFLLGNNLIFDNVDNALTASKLINGKYKFITLDGEVINPGFSVTGGAKNKNNKTLNISEKIKLIISETKEVQENMYNLSSKISTHNRTILELNEEIQHNSGVSIRLEHQQQSISEKLNYLKIQYKNIMGKEFKDSSSPTIDENSIHSLTSKLSSINDEIELKNSIKQKYSKENKEMSDKISSWNKDLILEMDKLSDLKVKQNQLETRIGYNLQTLNNDYFLTLDSIKDHKWELKESKEEVRKIVHQMKEDISQLGYVNTESIELYEDIKERYDSLHANYLELEEAQRELLTTIEILDNKMEDSLRTTVEKIRIEFQKVFKDIFKGGTSNLKWEDPEDILNSGIEIIAKPPGKEVKNISLFSGGEKSMIAITLIFAILKVSKLPMLILDEAEAALDEANVERYVQYCLELNKLTQVILVTHRPGTMEKCDLLYGVTMQEKGETKLISIRLEQAKKMVE